MPGTLYVVATPIGNLEDITARALRVLGRVQMIACEDTRRTRRLLNHFQLRTPTESYHQFSERRKLEHFLQVLHSGQDIALVSDAGTPTLSDPGALLVQACRKAGLPVQAIPGASALLVALASSSFAGAPFLFWGFLPAKSRQRRAILESLARQTSTLIFFESPLRLQACLRDILEVLGNRRAYLGRELTKVFEETVEGCLSDLLARYQGEKVLGEITLILGGCPETPEKMDLTQATIWALELAGKEGLSTKDASRRAALRSGLPSRAIYQEILKSRRS